MEWSTLELQLVSCSDLKAFNLFQKPSVYAVVSIINGELKKKKQRQNCLQRQKTTIDRVGGGNPEWNHVMNFDIKSLVNNCSHLFLSYDLYCEGVIYGNNSIGKVRVPLKDLIDEFNEAVRFVRYQVRTSDGKPNGVLFFSYKLKGKTIKKYVTSSPEVKLCPAEPEIKFCEDKVQYPCIEVSEKSTPGICYPSLDYVNSPLPGFYSPPPNYKYKTTEDYNTNVPLLSPPGGYYHPYSSPAHCALSAGPWYGVESTGYSYDNDYRRWQV